MPVFPNGASNAVKRGDLFYRIKRPLVSPGDIFELDISPLALYVGPDSDIAEIKATYNDPVAPNQLSELVVSPGGPWVEKLESDPVKINGSTGLPAVIKITANDIVNNTYVRPAISPFEPTRRFLIPASIDLVAALSASAIGSIPSVRADKTFRFPQVPFEPNPGVPPDNGSTDLVIPIYGRRFISVQIIKGAGFGYVASFYTVSLQPGGGNTAAFALGSFTQAGIAAQTIRPTVIKLSNDISDYGGGNGVLPSIAAGPHGMADLLVINIAENPLTSPVVIQYVDIFIKVSDRENG